MLGVSGRAADGLLRGLSSGRVEVVLMDLAEAMDASMDGSRGKG